MENTLQTDRTPRARKGPLAGVRVADFCWMGVGAVATRMLADFGADVIKIEDRTRLDMPRRLPFYKNDPRTYGEEDANPDPNKGGLFNNYSRNKLGVTLNMRTDAGRELADQLIASSSVVTENFAPGVMERWGLTYERLTELCPEVIYARMSGYGHTGPHVGYRSYGPVIQAVSGLTFISGLPDREPSGWGLSYMDNQAAYYNSAAVLMAILHRESPARARRSTSRPSRSASTCSARCCSTSSVNGHTTRRPGFPTGNRLEHPQAAPHGVYPSLGEDRWVAIAVFDDEDWDAWSSASAVRTGPPTRASRRRPADSPSRTSSTSTCRTGRGTRTPHEVDAPPAGRRRVCRRRAGRRGPQRDRPPGRPSRDHVRARPPGDRAGEVRGQSGAVLPHRAGQLALRTAAG